MARPKVDFDRVATVLALAEDFGDKFAAESRGIQERTVRRYRADYAGRPEVAGAIREKRKLAAKELGLEMVSALRGGLLKMRECIAAVKPGEPGSLREVAGAVKILVDAQTLREVVHGEQLGSAGQDSKPPAPAGRLPAEGDSAPIH